MQNKAVLSLGHGSTLNFQNAVFLAFRMQNTLGISNMTGSQATDLPGF